MHRNQVISSLTMLDRVKKYSELVAYVCGTGCRTTLAVVSALACTIFAITASAQSAAQLVEGSEYVRGVQAFAEGDFQQAADLWLADAYRGSADAQFNVGVLYIEGKGLPVDRGEAIFWFTKAADQGHPEAQYNLGHLLLEQSGDVDKIREGIEWWRKSAEAGFPVAQFNYGRALFFGVGVNENRSESRIWIEKSASNGNARAQEFLTLNQNNFVDEPLSPRLTESTIADALSAAGTPELPPSIAEVEASEYVLVKGKPILMYSRFNTFSPIITRVGAKILLRVVAKKGGWILVQIPGGVPGWLRNDQLKSFESDKVEIIVESATVFADPTENTEANDIGKLLRGAKSLLLEREPGWSRVQLPEKIPGWIEADQVEIVAASAGEIARVWQSQRIKQRITALSSREIKIAGISQDQLASVTDNVRDSDPASEPITPAASASEAASTEGAEIEPAKVVETEDTAETVAQEGTPVESEQDAITSMDSDTIGREATPPKPAENTATVIEVDTARDVEEDAAIPSAPDVEATSNTDLAIEINQDEKFLASAEAESELAGAANAADPEPGDPGPLEVTSAQQGAGTVAAERIVVTPRSTSEPSIGTDSAQPAQQLQDEAKVGQVLAEGVAGKTRTEQRETIRRTRSEGVPVRAGPDIADPQVILLPLNTLVDIVGEQNGFAEVTIPGGVPVWIPESASRRRDGEVVIQANRVRAQVGPGGQNSSRDDRRILGLLPQGSALRVVQEQRGWLRVTASEWITGWVELDALESPRVRVGMEQIWAEQADTLSAHYAGEGLVELAVVPGARDDSLTGTGIDNDNAWLFEPTSRKFTLQLFSMQNQSSARSLYNSLSSRGQFFSTVVNGDRWYFMLLGKFLTPEAAQAVVNGLPRWASGARVRSLVRLQVNRCKKLETLNEDEAQGLDQMCRD